MFGEHILGLLSSVRGALLYTVVGVVRLALRKDVVVEVLSALMACLRSYQSSFRVEIMMTSLYLCRETRAKHRRRNVGPSTVSAEIVSTAPLDVEHKTLLTNFKDEDYVFLKKLGKGKEIANSSSNVT